MTLRTYRGYAMTERKETLDTRGRVPAQEKPQSTVDLCAGEAGITRPDFQRVAYLLAMVSS